MDVGSLCKPPYLPWDPSSPSSSAPSQRSPGAVGCVVPGGSTGLWSSAGQHACPSMHGHPRLRPWASLTPVSIPSLGKICRGCGGVGQLPSQRRASFASWKKLATLSHLCQQADGRQTAGRGHIPIGQIKKLRPETGPGSPQKSCTSAVQHSGARTCYTHTHTHTHATHTHSTPHSRGPHTETSSQPLCGNPKFRLSSRYPPRPRADAVNTELLSVTEGKHFPHFRGDGQQRPLNLIPRC